MEVHRISSSPVPPSVHLATIVVPGEGVRGGGPLSNPSNAFSASTASSSTLTTDNTSAGHPTTEGDPFANFSLTSNRACNPGATTNSWDAADNNSNLTFSQVAPAAPRRTFLMAGDSALTFADDDAGHPGLDGSPFMTRSSPRRRGEPAVKFAAFGRGSVAMESRATLGNEPRSVSWNPQGLFGATLEKFQSREATSHFSTATPSLGGTVLAADVPDDLPPEPSISARRRPSGPSIHAIQFDADFGGGATPFMSISSPGVSRRSISRARMSVPQLSTGSIQLSANSFEREAASPVTDDAKPLTHHSYQPEPQEPQQQRRSLLPPSSVASPMNNDDTIPAGHVVSPGGGGRTHRTYFPVLDAEGVPLALSAKSPSTDTATGRTPRSFRRTNTSASSRATLATTAIGEDDNDTPLQSCDFLEGTEAASMVSPSFRGVPASLPASSMTGMYETLVSGSPVMDEQRARAKIEFAEAAEFKKLRNLEVSEGLAQGRKDRAVERQHSKYAGDAALLQLDEDEKEQLDSSMRARMRAAEAEHQQSLRVLRAKERFTPCPPSQPPTSSSDSDKGFSRVSSQRRSAPDTPLEPSPSREAPSSATTRSSLAPAASPLPPLVSSLLSSEVRIPTPPLSVSHSSRDAEVLSEIQRQRQLKQRASFKRNAWKQDDAFQKLT